jgi:hypothetical protein
MLLMCFDSWKFKLLISKDSTTFLLPFHFIFTLCLISQLSKHYSTLIILLVCSNLLFRNKQKHQWRPTMNELLLNLNLTFENVKNKQHSNNSTPLRYCWIYKQLISTIVRKNTDCPLQFQLNFSELMEDWWSPRRYCAPYFLTSKQNPNLT